MQEDISHLLTLSGLPTNTDPLLIDQLDLSDKKLKSLSPAIKTFTNLGILKLQNNNLTDLPQEIWTLTKLKIVDLSDCKLGQISWEIKNFRELRIIDLRNNKLSSIPQEIWSLAKLEIISLSDNNLSRISSEIKNLPELHTLELWGNELADLPQEIGSLNKLQNLDVCLNQLRQLPGSLWSLSSLQYLDLSHNNLTEISDEIKVLQELVELDVSYNKLKELPGGLWELLLMKDLKVDNNELQHLAATVGNLEKLQSLDISDNEIQEIAITLTKCTELSKFVCYGNKLSVPDEVIAGGVTRVFEYLQLIQEQNGVPDTRRNVLVVGDTMAGKTSFIRCLLEEQASLTTDLDRTHVMDRYKYRKYRPVDPTLDLDIQIYDFGGQEQYNPTTTMFWAQHSVFPIVVDLNTYESHNHKASVSWWIESISGRIPRAHIVFIGTHTDLCEEGQIRAKAAYISDISQREQKRVGEHIEGNVKELELKIRDCQQQVDIVMRGATGPGTGTKLQTEKERLQLDKQRLQRQLSERPIISDTVHLVSCKNYGGIEAAWADILGKLADQNLFPNKLIPWSWHQLKQQMLIAEGCNMNVPWLRMDQVESLGKQIRHTGMGTQLQGRTIQHKGQSPTLQHQGQSPIIQPQSGGSSNQEPSHTPESMDTDAICAALDHLQMAGDIVWEKDNVQLRTVVFHRPDVLLDIIKPVISHDLVDQLVVTDTRFTHLPSARLAEARKAIRQTGVIHRDILRCIWKDMARDEDELNIMIELLLRFDLGYVVPRDPKKLRECNEIRLPCYLPEQRPSTVPWLESVPRGRQQVTLEYSFGRWSPLGLFPTLSTRLQRHVSMSLDWKYGVYGRIDATELLLLLQQIEKQDRISLSVRSHHIRDIWRIVLAVRQDMDEVVGQWPGLMYDSYIVCPSCVRKGLPDPCHFEDRWLKEECNNTNISCKNTQNLEAEAMEVDIVYPSGDGEYITVIHTINSIL